ncbi:MAG TPA: energy transducer TonB [Terracidiphilus sp.]|nr:energy transducer TonB [Terracidiphilus sp.]
MSYSPGRLTFGMLPEPEGRSKSFFTSAIVNLSILSLILVISMMTKHVIERHYEVTTLIAPTTPPPEVKPKVPPPPKLPPPPQTPKLELQPKMIEMPKPKPEPKPVQLEAKLTMPTIKQAKPNIIEQPQPKAALTAAMPAQDKSVKPSTAPVHLGETFGVKPNPYATQPATVAAIGNPYGGMKGPAVAPHGVVGSTGIGNGLKSGSNSGIVGHVASAGIPGATNGSPTGGYGKVGSAGIPAVQAVAVVQPQAVVQPATTSLEVLSKPPVQYTPEARQQKIEGDVILRCTFTAAGQVIVQGVVRGLGHGLDEEARRVAQQIKFRPATRNGQPVDLTTNITITFQLA